VRTFWAIDLVERVLREDGQGSGECQGGGGAQAVAAGDLDVHVEVPQEWIDREVSR